MVLGAYDGVSAGDELEYALVGFIPDALAPDREVEERLGAKVSLVPELGENDRASA